MPSARRVAAIGVLALAGALIAVPAAGARAKVRQVPAAGLVTIGKVRCAAIEACAVKAVPRQAKVRVAGKAVRARVVVPPFLGAGGEGAVKLRLGPGALQRLAGHSATFAARVVVSGSGRRVAKNFKVRLARRAAPAGRSGSGSPGAPVGGNGGPTGEGAHSEAISGEAPVLARPLSAVTVEDVSVKWYPRASWIRYVATGEGTVASGGALTVAAETSACPAQAGSREGAEAAPSGQAFPYEVDFGAAESWFDPASGQAAIDGSGSVSFRYRGHTINLTGSEPEIQLNGGASQAVFRFSGSEGTPYPNQRVALLSLATAGQPTQVTTSEGKTTYTYGLMRGTLTADGEKVFAGFYPAPTNNGFGCVSASFTVP
ncbi:MAG TPA: HtaA domain-containing protein [Solirubrobacterales bacterium]|nr:HtaA domain-containing protein [Solirubrobacterales bacterium]